MIQILSRIQLCLRGPSRCRAALAIAALLSAGLAVTLALRGPRRFSIVVLPDTQFYAERYPQMLDGQVDWILAERRRRNIVFVSHEGDVVQHFESELEWARADAALSRLFGAVPFGILPGNHDMSPAGGTENYLAHFGSARFDRFAWYGGDFPAGTNANSFQLFSAGGYGIGPLSVGGDRFVVLHLAFCPGADIVAWADRVLRLHADRHAIIVTHGYINTFGERHVQEPAFGCMDASENARYLFDRLAFPHPNVFLVLSGHEFDAESADGEAHRVDLNVAGRPVTQILANYQRRPHGGDGWLRILNFLPALGQIHVRTYSPALGRYENDADSDFWLSYPRPLGQPRWDR